MPAEVLIVVPVLNRPGNARPLVESVEQSAATDWFLTFVCSGTDEAEVDACFVERERCDRVSVSILPGPPGPGDYAAKIQAGYDNPVFQDAPFVLLGADDLRFHPGWDVAVLAVAREFDVGVVGTNDCSNPTVVAGHHSTHPLVSRCYIDRLGGVVGEPGTVYYQGYSHQQVDSELVETAKARGCYAHCHEARIEHLHPLFGKGKRDATYEKALAGTTADRKLFRSREHLWQRERVTV